MANDKVLIERRLDGSMRDRSTIFPAASAASTRLVSNLPVTAARWKRESGEAPRFPATPTSAGSADFFPHREPIQSMNSSHRRVSRKRVSRRVTLRYRGRLVSIYQAEFRWQ